VRTVRRLLSRGQKYMIRAGTISIRVSYERAASFLYDFLRFSWQFLVVSSKGFFYGEFVRARIVFFIVR